MSAFTFIARMIFLDEVAYPVFVPQNEGMLRPVHVDRSRTGQSSIRAFLGRASPASARCSAPSTSRYAHLAPVVPTRVTAGNSAHLHFISYSGFDPDAGEYWVYLEVDEGSYGGRADKDGLDSVDCLIANTRNNPIEELEWRFPMRTERYELRGESAAPGKWRGGIGVVRVNRFLVDTIVTCEGERHESDPPWGLFGGADGLNAALVKNPGVPTEEAWPSKLTAMRLAAGDCLKIVTPSSGGYGDPLERDPDLVLADVLDGFTTVELAATQYGVVIEGDCGVIDVDATRRLREERVRRTVSA